MNYCANYSAFLVLQLFKNINQNHKPKKSVIKLLMDKNIKYFLFHGHFFQLFFFSFFTNWHIALLFGYAAFPSKSQDEYKFLSWSENTTSSITATARSCALIYNYIYYSYILLFKFIWNNEMVLKQVQDKVICNECKYVKYVVSIRLDIKCSIKPDISTSIGIIWQDDIWQILNIVTYLVKVLGGIKNSFIKYLFVATPTGPKSSINK